MQAIVIHEHGGVDVLKVEQRPEPVPRADEVLIDVHAVGINHLDLWVRQGVPGHTFPLPMIPGCDFAGKIVEVGAAAQGLSVGDRVLAAPGFGCGRCERCASGDDHLCRSYGIFGETRDGGCAERVAIPATHAIPVPDGIDFVHAAAFPLTFLTAWHMLVGRCGVQPGDCVLVHAAGSGVGSAAIQIAKLHNAEVIATASTDAKLKKARELGADHVINYAETDFVKEVKALTDRRGVDIVFEHVGEATIGGSIRSLAKGGRLVTCGATSGPKLETDLRLVFFKSLSILGSTMGSRGELLHVVRLVGQGLLNPVVDEVLPLQDVAEAHAQLARRALFGKIVLTTGAWTDSIGSLDP